MEDIKVSIICNAFNHEKYIRKCLEGFVMQKTNFEFEVLIHDDASTDKTAEIIREFEEKYPNLIKPIYQTENQYSQGKSPSYVFQYPRAKGEYFAVCEGDDYWTNPDKLQKQVDALDSHPEVDMCATKAKEVVANTEEFIRYVTPKNETCVIPLEDVIIGGGSYFATNSLLYRNRLALNEYDFRKILRIDYTIQISGAVKGGIYYIDEDMCSYRVLADNSWTAVAQKNPIKKINTYNKIIQMLDCLNKETEFKYDKTVAARKEYYYFQIALLNKNYGEFSKHKRELKKYLSSTSIKEKIYIILMIIKSKIIKK